jgi:hypothetical protein
MPPQIDRCLFPSGGSGSLFRDTHRLAEAVRAHDERSLTGVVTPVSSVDSMVGELVARVSGFGLLQPFVDAMLSEGHRLHVVLEGSWSVPRRSSSSASLTRTVQGGYAPFLVGMVERERATL